MLHFPHLGAFESTNIHGTGLDVLRTTRHDEFWRDDLTRLKHSGITELRYPIPWHRIEPTRGEYDWSWIDGPLRLISELELQPILDPLHHVSFPEWLTDGFLNPDFPAIYAAYLEQVARRYPWATRYTVFNEPLPTLALCAFTGAWYPHRRSDDDFVGMAIHVAEAVCRGFAVLAALNPAVELVQTDGCECHYALDEDARPWVEHANERRFLFYDLMLGRVTGDHALLPYLKAHGFTPRHEEWFMQNRVRLAVVGLDYYAHSELEWHWNREANAPQLQFPCQQPRGFQALGLDYYNRYRLPIMLTETNVGGTVYDRITWLKYMEEQSELLAQSADFRGFCWFPSIDATDWNSLCTRADHCLSPMGVWSLDENLSTRYDTELSRWYTALACGQVSSKDVPAYNFRAPLDVDLRGFLRFMSHWTDWKSQP